MFDGLRIMGSIAFFSTEAEQQEDGGLELLIKVLVLVGCSGGDSMVQVVGVAAFK